MNVIRRTLVAFSLFPWCLKIYISQQKSCFPLETPQPFRHRRAPLSLRWSESGTRWSAMRPLRAHLTARRLLVGRASGVWDVPASPHLSSLEPQRGSETVPSGGPRTAPRSPPALSPLTRVFYHKIFIFKFSSVPSWNSKHSIWNKIPTPVPNSSGDIFSLSLLRATPTGSSLTLLHPGPLHFLE